MLSERMVRLTRRLMNVLFPSGWDNIQFDAVHEALRTAAREAARAAYQDAEKVCDKEYKKPSSLWEERGCWLHACENCENAIRARREGLK